MRRKPSVDTRNHTERIPGIDLRGLPRSASHRRHRACRERVAGSWGCCARCSWRRT